MHRPIRHNERSWNISSPPPAEQNKFVNLHTKAGEKEILDLLEKYDVRRAIIHWYSGPMDILRAMIDFGCYFTIGVEVLYSDYIKSIAKAVPDHLLLTETDNPGALRWLKKNDEVGMPAAIKDVVNVARRAEAINSREQSNRWFRQISYGLSPTTPGFTPSAVDYFAKFLSRNANVIVSGLERPIFRRQSTHPLKITVHRYQHGTKRKSSGRNP